MSVEEFTLWQALHLEHPDILLPVALPFGAVPNAAPKGTSDPKEFFKLLRASR